MKQIVGFLEILFAIAGTGLIMLASIFTRLRMFCIFLFLFAYMQISAQNQSLNADPFTADSIQYYINPDSSVTVLVIVNAGTVSFQEFQTFLENRAKTLLNQASQLEQIAQARREKAAREREAFEDRTGKDASELFKDRLEKLSGDWTIKIGNKSDVLTIAADGSFTSVKSGAGQIKFVAEDKIILALADGTTIELFENGADWRTADGNKVTLKRVK